MNMRTITSGERAASQRIGTRFLTSHQKLWCSGGVPTGGVNSLYPVAGFPVFLNPYAERFIAQVPGFLRQIWNSQGTFVDVYRCLQSQNVMRGIWVWAESNGYVLRKTLYRIDYDGELREKRRSLWDDHTQARQEYDALKSDGIAGVRFVTFSGYGPLPSLKERAQVEHLFLSCVPELVLACFVVDVMPKAVDGIWWQEEDRPEAQSVPHGVIFPHRIDFWDTRPRE